MSLKGTHAIQAEVRAVSVMRERLESEGITIWEEESLEETGLMVRKPTLKAFARACEICEEERAKTSSANRAMLAENKARKKWSVVAFLFIVLSVVLLLLLLCGPGNTAGSTVETARGPVEMRYVASMNSNKYHRLSCNYEDSIYPANRVYYEDKGSAEADFKEPCAVCKP